MKPSITSGFRESAKYVFVGEALGAEEESYGRPYIGASGQELYKLLEESRWIPFGSANYIIKNFHPWYDPEQHRMRISAPHFLPLDKTLEESFIFITNVCHARPPNNDIQKFFYTKTEAKKLRAKEINGRYPNSDIIDGMKQLYRDLQTIKPIITVALGGTALWALTGLEGITKWRGSILEIDEKIEGELY